MVHTALNQYQNVFRVGCLDERSVAAFPDNINQRIQSAICIGLRFRRLANLSSFLANLSSLLICKLIRWFIFSSCSRSRGTQLAARRKPGLANSIAIRSNRSSLTSGIITI